MPAEYYVGTAIAVVMLFLLGQLFRRRPARRENVHKGNGTDQLTIQLSRIADALETLVVHLGASPPPRVEQSSVEKHVHAKAAPAHVEQPPVPLQKAPEPSGTGKERIDQPSEHHVNLSMFGR